MSEIEELLLERGCEGAVMLPDYEEAFIGTTDDGRAAYSYDQMVNVLTNRDKMTYEDAVEWIEYNTIRALPYAGDRAPVIIYGI